MILCKEQARNVICEDHEDWETIEIGPVDHRRWSVSYEGIFKHIPTNKFYRLSWSEGATEFQDERPFEYEEPEPVEVRQVEKVVKVWEQV